MIQAMRASKALKSSQHAERKFKTNNYSCVTQADFRST